MHSSCGKMPSTNTKGSEHSYIASYSDWSPTLSSVPHGMRVIAAISASNFVSRPCTNVTNAFVIIAENSSCTDKWFLLNNSTITIKNKKEQFNSGTVLLALQTYLPHPLIEDQ